MSRPGVLVVFLALLTVPATSQTGGKWQFQTRMQVGSEYDSNIFESTRFPVEAMAARGLLKTSASRMLAQGKLALGWSAGMQLYPAWTAENKLNHLLSAAWGRALSRWWSISLKANAQAKLFLRAPYDHVWTWTAAGSTFRLPAGLRLKVQAASARLDYRASDRFDFLERSLVADLGRRFARRWQAGVGVEQGRLEFLRPAYFAGENGVRIIRAAQQQDTRRTFFLRLAYSGSRVIQIRLELQSNDSNSEGYSWQRRRLYLVAAQPLATSWLLRIALMGQRKRYIPTDLAIPLIELDLERSESNYLVIDLTYDRSRQFSWLVRLALYNNEAAFRGFYYSKRQLLFGSEYRF